MQVVAGGHWTLLRCGDGKAQQFCRAGEASEVSRIIINCDPSSSIVIYCHPWSLFQFISHWIIELILTVLQFCVFFCVFWINCNQYFWPRCPRVPVHKVISSSLWHPKLKSPVIVVMVRMCMKWIKMVDMTFLHCVHLFASNPVLYIIIISLYDALLWHHRVYMRIIHIFYNYIWHLFD